MAHAMLVHLQVPCIAMAGPEKPALQRQLHLSSFCSPALPLPVTIQALTGEAETTLCRFSSFSLATSLRICRASERPATTGSSSDKQDGRQRTKGTRPDLIEEDIYTIDDGWKVDFGATEEGATKADKKSITEHTSLIMEVAGVQIPIRLKQQLQSERRNRWVVDRTPVEPPRATHKLLRVMAGRCAGKKLTSPADAEVRPMMEVVRGAVFDILKIPPDRNSVREQSLYSWTPSSPSGRWLDIYSGTDSVTIEALSRGCCAEAHFLEMDPWVISNVLRPNLEETNCENRTVVHTSKVETLLKRASMRGAGVFGGAFDYVSVTPPYEAVSYTELMTQLSLSPLLSDNTLMVVEYPIKSKHEIPHSCGALIKIKDRRYGRTHVAIYGPQWLNRDEEVTVAGGGASRI